LFVASPGDASILEQGHQNNNGRYGFGRVAIPTTASGQPFLTNANAGGGKREETTASERLLAPQQWKPQPRPALAIDAIKSNNSINALLAKLQIARASSNTRTTLQPKHQNTQPMHATQAPAPHNLAWGHIESQIEDLSICSARENLSNPRGNATYMWTPRDKPKGRLRKPSSDARNSGPNNTSPCVDLARLRPGSMHGRCTGQEFLASSLSHNAVEHWSNEQRWARPPNCLLIGNRRMRGIRGRTLLAAEHLLSNCPIKERLSNFPQGRPHQCCKISLGASLLGTC